MNESQELTTAQRTTHNSSSTPDTSSCNLISIIPNLGMSSCRGRAEAFARSLSSKLRTLGSQSEDEQDKALINAAGIAVTATVAAVAAVDEVDGAIGVSKIVNNTWFEQKLNVTDRQPVRHDTETFFDFDCELESPGSPADECEYLRLIETASNTPQNTAAAGESRGYACTSTPSSSSSTDATFYDTQNNTELSKVEDYIDLNGTLTNEHNEKENETEIIVSTTEENIAENKVKETKWEVTEKLLNGHMGKDVKLSNVKMENELTENNTITTTTKNNIKDIQNEIIKPEIIEIIKAELVEIKTDLKTTAAATTTETDAIKLDIEVTKCKNNYTQSGLDTTDDDEDECRPQRVRRCSSLKTGKTPPGTPGRKKIVRFADKLGLDLADIKTFLDEIPNIPKSAFEDLEINDHETPIQLGPKANKLLVPLFQQPGGLPAFLDLVRERQVSLENAAVTDHINQTITGSVRVRNLDFHKSVHIRYTLDHWRSFADLQAHYVENSCDGFSDKFSFILFGNSMQVGQRLEFAVRFQCKGQQFWDNNYGINYCFQCLPVNNSNNATITTTITTTAATTKNTTMTINNSKYDLHNNNNNSSNNNNNNIHNNNKNHQQKMINNHTNTIIMGMTAVNCMGKPINGALDQQHAESQVLRLLSPTAGEAWCGSFY